MQAETVIGNSSPAAGLNETNPASLAAARLLAHLSALPGVFVAYSGGVDSALLAYAAYRALGARMKAVLADSPSLSRREHRHAAAFARRHQIPLEVVQTTEIENPLYRCNSRDRCFHCKQALFEHIRAVPTAPDNSRECGDWVIVYGANRDDLGDFRPGMRAAAEAGVQAPFIDLGFGKAEIRAISAHFDLDIAAKPASPCLASRIAYGIAVTPQRLRQVELAEQVLYDLGIGVLRVRHHGSVARIEVMPPDFEKILTHRQRIRRKFQAIGFTHIALDLDGHRSGSLNADLPPGTADEEK